MEWAPLHTVTDAPVTGTQDAPSGICKYGEKSSKDVSLSTRLIYISRDSAFVDRTPSLVAVVCFTFARLTFLQYVVWV